MIRLFTSAVLLSASLHAFAVQESFGQGPTQAQPQPVQAQRVQPQPAPPPPGNPTPANGILDQLMVTERQDFGIAATDQLHAGEFHGPTPSSIPGGQVITTKGLLALVQGKQTPYFLFDVLGSAETLPGAMPSAWLAQAGSFNDPISQQFGQMLRQSTQSRTDVPLIFYCLSTQCWMSYNAALRAIKLGYTNVLWYRGGIEAWKSAGLPIQPAPQGYPPQQGGYPPPGQPGQPAQPPQPGTPPQPGYPQQR